MAVKIVTGVAVILVYGTGKLKSDRWLNPAGPGIGLTKIPKAGNAVVLVR